MSRTAVAAIRAAIPQTRVPHSPATMSAALATIWDHAATLDPSGAAYEYAMAAVTGVKADPAHWQGGRVSGVPGSGTIPVSVDHATLTVMVGDDVPGWHGTVPTGREVATADVREPLSRALALATDGRITLPGHLGAVTRAIAAGDVQADSRRSTGRIVLTRLAGALGTDSATARSALDAWHAWAGSSVARHLASQTRGQSATRYVIPRVMAGRVIGGVTRGVPAPAPLDGPALSTGAIPRTAVQRRESADRRRAARAARDAALAATLPDDMTVGLIYGPARPSAMAAAGTTGRVRYLARHGLIGPLTRGPATPPVPTTRAVSVCGICHLAGGHDDDSHPHAVSGATADLEVTVTPKRARAVRTARAPRVAAPERATSVRGALAALMAAHA